MLVENIVEEMKTNISNYEELKKSFEEEIGDAHMRYIVITQIKNDIMEFIEDRYNIDNKKSEKIFKILFNF
jgi:hypothetical protein